MSNFVGRPPFSNSLWVATETMQLHIAQTIFFEDTFVWHPEGPNKQFGTHEKLSWGMQGNRNWMLGYKIYEKISSGGLEVSLSIL